MIYHYRASKEYMLFTDLDGNNVFEPRENVNVLGKFNTLETAKEFINDYALAQSEVVEQSSKVK